MMTAEFYKKQLLEEYRQYAALDEKGQVAFLERIKAEPARKADVEKALFQDPIFENLTVIKDRLSAIKEQLESQTQQSTPRK